MIPSTSELQSPSCSSPGDARREQEAWLPISAAAGGTQSRRGREISSRLRGSAAAGKGAATPVNIDVKRNSGSVTRQGEVRHEKFSLPSGLLSRRRHHPDHRISRNTYSAEGQLSASISKTTLYQQHLLLISEEVT